MQEYAKHITRSMLVSKKQKPVLYHETLPRIGQNFTESLRGGKIVKKRKIF